MNMTGLPNSIDIVAAALLELAESRRAYLRHESAEPRYRAAVRGVEQLAESLFPPSTNEKERANA